MANGTIISAPDGYKWYPGSGVITTRHDEVFPFTHSRSQFIDWAQQDSLFENDDLSELEIPSEFKKGASGETLVHRIGLVAYQDGWVSTSDGFIVKSFKTTFS